jgi:hypothetical protein
VHERLIALCNELRLGGIAAQYPALAQTAAEKRTSFTDFLEELLMAERESRRARAREMFARVAGFPAIKTLDQYDFGFAMTSCCATAESRDNFPHLFYRTRLGYRQQCNNPQFWIIDHRERHVIEDHASHQRMIVLRAALAHRQYVMARPPLGEFRTDSVQPVDKLDKMRVAGITAVIGTEPG